MSIYFCLVDVPFASVSGGFDVTLHSSKFSFDITQTVTSIVHNFDPQSIPDILTDIKDDEWPIIGRLATLTHKFSRPFYDCAQISPSPLVRLLFDLQPEGHRRSALSLLDYSRDFFESFDLDAPIGPGENFLIDLASQFFWSFVHFGPIALIQTGLKKMTAFDVIRLDLPFENNTACFERNVQIIEDFMLFQTSSLFLICAYQAAFHRRFVMLARQWCSEVERSDSDLDVFWAFYRRLTRVANLANPPGFVTLFAEFVSILWRDLPGFLAQRMDEFCLEELGEFEKEKENGGEEEARLLGEFLRIDRPGEAREFARGRNPS
jgi:hypothetical protein